MSSRLKKHDESIGEQITKMMTLSGAQHSRPSMFWPLMLNQKMDAAKMTANLILGPSKSWGKFSAALATLTTKIFALHCLVHCPRECAWSQNRPLSS